MSAGHGRTLTNERRSLMLEILATIWLALQVAGLIVGLGFCIALVGFHIDFKLRGYK